MNKMMNPEMEVVRFGAEDVIATSLCGADSQAINHFYFDGNGNLTTTVWDGDRQMFVVDGSADGTTYAIGNTLTGAALATIYGDNRLKNKSDTQLAPYIEALQPLTGRTGVYAYGDSHDGIYSYNVSEVDGTGIFWYHCDGAHISN